MFSSVNACQNCDEKMDSYIASAEAALSDENFDLAEQEQILQIFTQGNLKRFLENCSDQDNKFSLRIKEINLRLLYNRFLSISADGILDEQKWRELLELIDGLGITGEEIIGSNFGEEFRGFIVLNNLYRGLNGLNEMPVIDDPEMILQKNETCFLRIPANLVEFKTKSHYVGGHSGISIRLSKSVRWNTGAFKGEQVTEEVREITDSGCLMVTNKRAVFVGELKNVVYPLVKIVNVTKWPDAVAFQKENEEVNKCFILTSEYAVHAVGMVTQYFATGEAIPVFQPQVILQKGNVPKSDDELLPADSKVEEEKVGLMINPGGILSEGTKKVEATSSRPPIDPCQNDKVGAVEKEPSRSNDLETQILSGIAVTAINALSPVTNRPNRRSKWAGIFTDGRYYKIWYSNSPWENHAFSYQMHLYTDGGNRGLGVKFFFWIKEAKNKGLTAGQILVLAEKMRFYAEREGFEYKYSDQFYSLEKFFNPSEETSRKDAAQCLKELIEAITPAVEMLNESAV